MDHSAAAAAPAAGRAARPEPRSCQHLRRQYRVVRAQDRRSDLGCKGNMARRHVLDPALNNQPPAAKVAAGPFVQDAAVVPERLVGPQLEVLSPACGVAHRGELESKRVLADGLGHRGGETVPGDQERELEVGLAWAHGGHRPAMWRMTSRKWRVLAVPSEASSVGRLIRTAWSPMEQARASSPRSSRDSGRLYRSSNSICQLTSAVFGPCSTMYRVRMSARWNSRPS